MMEKHCTGLMLGAFLGLVHLLWAILVAAGFGQSFLDFVYKIHFLNNPFTVAPFDIGKAALLVILTAFIGYIGGWLLTFLWEKCKEKK